MAQSIDPLDLHERMVREVEQQKKLDGVFISDFARGMQWMQEFVTLQLSKCDHD